MALQEVTAKTRAALQGGLQRIGLKYTQDSFCLAPRSFPPKGPRRYGEIVASRWPLVPLPPSDFDIPWPERVLSVVVQSPWGEIEVHTAHIPCGASHEWKKIRTLEGIFQRLAREAKRHRILCGDFNSPQQEDPGGHVVTWGQYRNRNGEIVIYKGWGNRWDKGERNIIEGLAVYDLPDVYRFLNGYKGRRSAFSWCWRGKAPCRRFDHTFASGSLNGIKCTYVHRLREKGLSDHSAMEAVFEPTRKRSA